MSFVLAGMRAALFLVSAFSALGSDSGHEPLDTDDLFL